MNHNVILLLKIVEVNGSILLLKKRGLSISQIANLIEEQEKQGNICNINNKITLTGQGREYLNDNIFKITGKGKKDWIVKQSHYYREPISRNEIVLPRKI